MADHYGAVSSVNLAGTVIDRYGKNVGREDPSPLPLARGLRFLITVLMSGSLLPGPTAQDPAAAEVTKQLCSPGSPVLGEPCLGW